MKAITRETSSLLPLVPYFTTDHPEISKMMAYELAARYSVENGIAQAAIESVYRENYKRRFEEAHITSLEAKNAYFDENRAFKGSISELDAYIEMRKVDGNHYATIGERVDLFERSDNPKLQAYEIFARPHCPNDDVHDLSLARDCLKIISDNSVTPSPVWTLPKLVRRIATDETDQRVVTTKTDVGSYELDGERVHLNRRSAGLLDYHKLDDTEKEVIDYLTNYNRSLGRTATLMAARNDLQSIIDDRSDCIYPVVESLFLTRKNAQDTIETPRA